MRHIIGKIPPIEYNALLQTDKEWLAAGINFYYFILLEPPQKVSTGAYIYICCEDRIVARGTIFDIAYIGQGEISESRNMLWRHEGKWVVKYNNLHLMIEAYPCVFKGMFKIIGSREAAKIQTKGQLMLYEGIDAHSSTT